MLAGKLLSQKASRRSAGSVLIKTHDEFASKSIFFGDALLDLVSLVPDVGPLLHRGRELPPDLKLLCVCFGIPANEIRMAYWDIVADRRSGSPDKDSQ